MVTICQITTAHPRYDIRIFQKQCKSLAAAGYEVHLIVADGKGDELKDGVHITDVGKPQGRMERMLDTPAKVYRKARELSAEVYHFHDPEFMWYGRKLAKKGYRVVFDIHENVAVSIKDKYWIPSFLRGSVRFLYRAFEQRIIRAFSRLVLAEDSYARYYPDNHVVILNYPLVLDTSDFDKVRDFSLPYRLVYAGGISEIRGIWQTMGVFHGLVEQGYDVSLDLLGPVYPEELKEELEEWSKERGLSGRLRMYGFVPLQQVYEVLDKSHIGMAFLKPIDNYRESLPTKIFEYMLKGIPVVTSDFQLYKKYVTDAGTGLCLDYYDVTSAVREIGALLDDKERLARMSKNAKLLILKDVNWHTQEIKLLAMYKELLES